MIVDDAQAKILEQIDSAVSAVGARAEEISIAAALGRVLADAIVAPADEPPVALSAMDGFAVRAADLEAVPRAMTVAFEVVAGAPPGASLPTLECARIFTGAPLPDGADTIVMQEDVVSADGVAHFAQPVEAGAFVRAPGSELRAGERVLDAGETIGPSAIALLVALGHAQVRVRRRPRVAVFSTGSELVDVLTASGPRRPGMLYDSNGPSLAAWVRLFGGDVTELPAVGDDRDATIARLSVLEEYDFVVSTGGVSVGDHDHVRPALDAAGWETILWRVAMKPGKPVIVARQKHTIYFGLPGNPASAMVGFQLFVRPALRRALGQDPFDDVPRVVVVTDEPIVNRGERRHYLRATARIDFAGTVRAAVATRQGSASLPKCNALLIAEPGADVAAGGLVTALLIAPLATR